MSKLQKVFLQNLPAIPLWYNGMWSMVNDQYWTNWPSATGGQYTPDLVAELLADDEHRHAHAPQDDEVGAEGTTRDRSTPLPAATREGCRSSGPAEPRPGV